MALIRDIHPDTLAALEAGNFHPVLLVYLDWPNAPLRAHTGVGPIQWDGNEWHGVGEFGDVQIPGEAAGLASAEGELSLFGLDDTLDDYLDDDIRGRAARIYAGVTTERGGNTLIGDPFLAFAGYMDALRDNVEVTRDEGQRTIMRGVRLTIAHAPSQRSTAGVYHTYQDQITKHPGDTAGRYATTSERDVSTTTHTKWPG